MTKQTARNNVFLKEVKSLYNVPFFKKFSKMVNEGQQDIAEYMVETGLHGFHRPGEMTDVDAAEILMNNNFEGKANSPENISLMFDKAIELRDNK